MNFDAANWMKNFANFNALPGADRFQALFAEAGERSSQAVERSRAVAEELADRAGLDPQSILECADAVLPAIVGIGDHLAFRGGQIGAAVALAERGLDVLDIIGDALRRAEQLTGLLDLLLKRRQRRDGQRREVLALIDQ